MMMAEQTQDRSALRWIRGELDQTLRQARTSLEDFVEGQQEALQACVDNLHHVHGALEMVQVYGGAMLADEMEQLAVALSHGQVKREDAAAEALMLGVVQLPAYLEKIETGAADVPLALLPLMNDLRAAREAPLVSETSLFAPKLDAVIAADTVRPGSGNRELPQLIRQHRSHFHRALLNWIRGHEVSTSVTQIRDLLDVLNSAAGTGRLRRLLDAGEALATALLDDDEAPALAVRPLFGKLDRVFKQVIDQGEEAAMLEFPVDLLKNLLYYIARSNSQDPAVVAVKRSADLVNSFPDQPQDGLAAGSLGGPDREMFAAVGEALAQDLRSVKDQLDLFMRSDRSQLARLTDLAQPVQRIADTLGMVGRGDLRTRLKRRCDELRSAGESGTPPPDDRLMSLASDLLLVESSLTSLAKGGQSTPEVDPATDRTAAQSVSEGEMQQHLRAAVDEALVELAKTKDAILEYLEKPDQTALLNDVSTRLHMVTGVLRMLDMAEAGRLLGELEPYIAGLASGKEAVPDAAGRDAIADLVISTELYMQSAVEPGTDRQRLLAFADAALRKLGLRGADSQAASSVIELYAAASNAETAEEAPKQAAVSADEPDDGPQVSVEEPRVPVEASQVSVEDSQAAVEHAQTEEAQSTGSAQQPGEQVSEPESELAVDVDSEILEVFAEEAHEELQVIQDCYPKWRDNDDDRESLTTMRRSFHTLKGSGRIVGAGNLGEFSWSVENLLNRVIDGTVPIAGELLGLMDEVVAVLPRLVEESGQPRAAGTDVSAISERAFAIASGSATTIEGGGPESSGEPDHEVIPLPLGRAWAQPEGGQALTEDSALAGAGAAGAEPESLQEQAVEADRPDNDVAVPSGQDGEDAVVERQAAEATGDEVAVEPEAAQFSDPVGGAENSLVPAGDAEAEMDESAAAMPAADSAPPGYEIPDESILTDTAVEDSDFSELEPASPVAPDTSLYAVFLNEAQGHLRVLADFVRRCRETADGCVFDSSVQRAMHTLRGSSRTAGVTPMAELAGSLEALGNVMCDSRLPLDVGMLELLDRGHRTLSDLAAAVEEEAPGREVEGWDKLCAEIHRKVEDLAHPRLWVAEIARTADELESLDPELLEVFLEEAKELLEALEGELSEWQDAAGDGRAAVAKLQRTLHTMKGGARLAGVAAIGDLSHSLESVFESVSEQRVSGSGRLKELVRHATDALNQDIELLVGGTMPAAHVPMIERLEAAAHGREWDDVAASEAPIERREAVSPASASAATGETAPAPTHEPAAPESRDDPAAAADTVLEDEFGVDSELLTDSQLLTDSELLRDSSFAAEAATAIDLGPIGSVATDGPKVIQFPKGDQAGDEDGFVPRRPPPQEEPKPASGTERVRVASEALDHMVNNAGEVSIYRARLEQLNSSFSFNLGELGQTTDRLRAQLRDLELETEAQILSRHERESESRADFDPLELDRYSTMQQLSRALSETVEDLSNLGQSLSELSRDTDTLLLQQSRVTTDLQDSLLRTRMVKFSSRVPRLERVVRQTSHSVGKEARLEVIGGAEDMDRAILERMMGPLEHLLRNAVSHGIEDANTRLANDKPAQGRITLQLAREGTEIVLRLTDDGAGLDQARIRSKAVERGLLEANASVKDDDLYQLILQPGFSTALELSQVSGRGVGMDVVLTEVKQLGGSLEIDSEPGGGTTFTIRLPFTLAITDALLVTMGEDIYAIPHSSMDGVVRIALDELRTIYAGDQPTFRYGERDYDVRYLGAMLGTQAPHLSEGTRWLPMLLVRSGEHRVAIQVDGMLGNRQIVVKSIGAQLSTVRWFTGGTILADGQIALILDVNSLVRMDSSHQPAAPLESAAPLSKGVTVMVVDDSITVRKVTSRLLERHNMHVMTAKDGVDAVTQLQEQRPDVMLLDIEMPRMDGFELARHMRSTPELSDIPIIMITSRTGDKHRNRALELGVRRYLGKPYQEADLLENIYTVLADSAL